MPTVFVTEDVMRALREQCLVRYGKLYGAIRKEVEAAVKARVDTLKRERVSANA